MFNWSFCCFNHSLFDTPDTHTQNKSDLLFAFTVHTANCFVCVCVCVRIYTLLCKPSHLVSLLFPHGLSFHPGLSPLWEPEEEQETVLSESFDHQTRVLCPVDRIWSSYCVHVCSDVFLSKILKSKMATRTGPAAPCSPVLKSKPNHVYSRQDLKDQHSP